MPTDSEKAAEACAVLLKGCAGALRTGDFAKFAEGFKLFGQCLRLRLVEVPPQAVRLVSLSLEQRDTRRAADHVERLALAVRPAATPSRSRPPVTGSAAPSRSRPPAPDFDPPSRSSPPVIDIVMPFYPRR